VRGAARLPIVGSERVARFTAGFVAKGFWTGASLRRVEANGRASVLLSRDGADYAFVTVSASPSGIDRVLWVLNPPKLAAISRPRSTSPVPPARAGSTTDHRVH
jgi:RNA polymerase sigma-70 factor, ECF subfamily